MWLEEIYRIMGFIPFVCVIFKVEVPSNVSNVGTEISDNHGIHSHHSIDFCYFEGENP